MPKNPEHFYSKLFLNDVNRIANEYIKIFEDALQNRNVHDEDVACRLFPYSLGEESFYQYINLPSNSIQTWQQLKNAFLGKSRLPMTLAELYRQFIKIRRQECEPISAFNNRFQKAYSRLHDPYHIRDDAAQPIYYAALDCFTSMFVQKTHPTPTTLIQAYAKVERVSLQSPVTTSGAPNYFRNANKLNQGALN